MVFAALGAASAVLKPKFTPRELETVAALQNKILTQLRCHEAKQTMAPACWDEKGNHGQKA
jgi:hypothetical protein